MKIAVITSGFLPVPATKGGAVENLLVNLMDENEKKEKINFIILSAYDEKAYLDSQKYKKSNFIFIKTNKLIKILDRIVFFTASKILKKKNSHSYRYIFQRLSYLWKCSRILKKNNYDKVLLENHPTQFLALKWNNNYKKYRNRYYYHCHNEFPGKYGCDKVISGTKKIISVSKFRQKTIIDYLKLPSEKFVVLKNAINTCLISKKATNIELKELKEKYHILPNDKVLLFVGRIVPEKGVKELILAIKKVKNKNFKLLLLGSSLNALNVMTYYEKDVFNLIDDSISNRIIPTGFVNYEDLYKYYSITDIAVFPSIWDDSAPLTVIEAVSCGLPLITTKSGGIPEYVNKECAIILPRDKNLIKNIAISIDLLLNNEKLRSDMSHAALDKASEYGLEKFYDDFLRKVDIE